MLLVGNYAQGEAWEREACFIEISGDHIVNISPALADRLGFDPSALKGLPLDELIPNHEAEHLLELLIKFGLDQPIPPTRPARLMASNGKSFGADVCLRAVEPTVELAFQFIDERAVRNVIRRYKDIYESVAEGIYRCTLDGVQLAANPALVQLNGFSSEAEMLSEVNDIELQWYVDPNRRSEFHSQLMTNGVVNDFVSEIYRYKSREKIWISENARLVRDRDTNQPLFYEGTIREVTEHMTSLSQNENHAKIAAQAPGLLFQSCLPENGPPRFTFASEGSEQLCGLSPRELVEDGSLFIRRVDPRDRSRIAEGIFQSAANLTSWTDEFRLRKTSGEDIWVGGTATPERKADGTIIWHGFVHDITQRRNTQDQLAKLAFKDPLTGLGNRAMLTSEGAARIEAASKEGMSVALLFIDLDNFKALNDLHGHAAGDEFLETTANRLRDCVSADDLVVRLGGDEFVVLLHNADQDAAETTARQILPVLGEAHFFNDTQHRSTPSIGIAISGKTANTLDRLLRHADLAMYTVKAKNKNDYAVFQKSMERAIEERAVLQADIRKAILSSDMELYVQPLVDARSRRAVGGEGLLRWHTQALGWVRPDHILATADELGFGRDLQLWVLNRACQIIKEWDEEEALQSATLSINISPSYLQSDGLVGDILRVLKEQNVRPSRIVLEVTEHGVLDNLEDIALKLGLLRAHGLRVALDDFGTGYSCLTYLKKLPIDEVKVDHLFVRDIEHNEDDQAIVDAVIGVAARLNLSITAEGVETQSQADYLTRIGCTKLQGHTFERALPAAEFLQWYKAQNGVETMVNGRAGQATPKAASVR